MGQGRGEAGTCPAFRCLVGAGAGTIVGPPALVENLAQSSPGATGLATQLCGCTDSIDFVPAFGCFNMGGFVGMKGVELRSGYIPTLFVRTTRGEDGPVLLGTVFPGKGTGEIAFYDVHSNIDHENVVGCEVVSVGNIVMVSFTK